MNKMPPICIRVTCCFGDCHKPNCDTIIDPNIDPVRPNVTVMPAPTLGTKKVVEKTNKLPKIPPMNNQNGLVLSGAALANECGSLTKINIKIITVPIINEITALATADPSK